VSGVRVAALSFWYALRQIIVNPAVLFMVLVQPLALAAVAAFVLRPLFAEGQAIRVALGGGLAGMWTSLLFGAAYSFDDERWAGTLELLASAPSPLVCHVAGKSLADVVLALLSLGCGYGVAMSVAGRLPDIALPGAFALSLALALIGFMAMGLCLAPVFGMYLPLQVWTNAVEYPVYILAGFMFPVAILPGWTTPLSWALPPFWAAVALEASAQGDPGGDLAPAWAALVALSVVYAALSILLFRVAAQRFRLTGKMDVT